jgi:CheY-like chemotaxis protein
MHVGYFEAVRSVLYDCHMGVECLVVTSDTTLLDQITAGLSGRRASLDLRQDSASAIELASRRHLDGLVIDCDDVHGGTEALAHFRKSRSNKQSTIFAVVNHVTSAEVALDLGANFVLGKPIHESRLRSLLDSAIPRMEREHQRYFRYGVDLPVRFHNTLGDSLSAKMQNISEGGLAIRPIDPVKLQGVVIVEFEVPSLDPQVFHAKADVVWADSFVMGLRFLYVEKNSEAILQSWLDSLEAQLRFREFAQRPFDSD